MKRYVVGFLLAFFFSLNCFAQSDSIVLRDVQGGEQFPASFTELFIPSGQSLMAGFIYRASGSAKHPTLLLLHGYPGNERNLDLAQVVRAHGWNVIYFDYRGSWGSQGKFSFKQCVEDVVNLVAFCKKYSDSLKIDTSNIALFGHSMGGWVCLKALTQLPGVRKGFALSTWNIGATYDKVLTGEEKSALANHPDQRASYFVLNASVGELFGPVLKDRKYFDLDNDAAALAGKDIVMLDEHRGNAGLAAAIRQVHTAYFDYAVWPTDHPFSNKRISLINTVLDFLNR